MTATRASPKRPGARRRAERTAGGAVRVGLPRHRTLLSGAAPTPVAHAGRKRLRDRTLLVEQKNVDGVIVTGQKNGRPPRTVELLDALRHDLKELRLPAGWAADGERLFPTPCCEPWREHEYRNWRKRWFQKLAPACGLGSRPYDLRHSFASLRIQEGRLTIVELAEQLGHSPAMTRR